MYDIRAIIQDINGFVVNLDKPIGVFIRTVSSCIVCKIQAGGVPPCAPAMALCCRLMSVCLEHI